MVGLDTLPADHKVPRVKNLLDGKPNQRRFIRKSRPIYEFLSIVCCSVQRESLAENTSALVLESKQCRPDGSPSTKFFTLGTL